MGEVQGDEEAGAGVDVRQYTPVTGGEETAGLSVLHRHPQFDPVVGSVNKILASAKVALGGLDTRVAQQKLNLLQLATGCATQLCGGSATIPRAA